MRLRISNVHLLWVYGIFHLAFSVTCIPAKCADKPLGVDDVVHLCETGKSDADIIKIILDRKIDFEITSPVIQKLVQSGVSAGIIQVLLSVSGSEDSNRNRGNAELPAAIPGISVSTDPPGMDVLVDGAKQGITPFLSNKIEQGSRLISVESPHFFSQEKKIFWDGKTPVLIHWKMEVREPIIRLRVQLENDAAEMPWSWIARSKMTCPDTPTLELQPLIKSSKEAEAIFVMTDESKQIFQSYGTACLEIMLWRGEIRSDLPLKDLPAYTNRYLISKIEINGIQFIDMLLKIQLNKLNPLNPKLTLESSTGILINTGDQLPPPDPEDLRDSILKELHKTQDTP